jgi:hypothetical protein
MATCITNNHNSTYFRMIDYEKDCDVIEIILCDVYEQFKSQRYKNALKLYIGLLKTLTNEVSSTKTTVIFRDAKIITGQMSASKKYGITPDQYFSCLKALKKIGAISVYPQPNVCTVIHIKNLKQIVSLLRSRLYLD